MTEGLSHFPAGRAQEGGKQRKWGVQNGHSLRGSSQLFFENFLLLAKCFISRFVGVVHFWNPFEPNLFFLFRKNCDKNRIFTA